MFFLKINFLFLELLNLLIKQEAHIEQEALNLYDAKINALIIATESGSFSCVKCLVEHGLDVNYKIKGRGETAGRTPLFCASVKNHPEIVEYLLVCGADVNAAEDVSFEGFFYSNNKYLKFVLLSEWTIVSPYCSDIRPRTSCRNTM